MEGEEEINAKIWPSDESLVPPAHEEASGPNHRQHRTKLLTELDEDNNARDEGRVEKINSEGDGGCSNEEIMKELKNIKRQNSITHYLLTALIVVTLAWQLSEVSLIFKIKNGLTNPLKSVGGLIKGFFRNRSQVNVQDVMKQASERRDQIIEPAYLPGLKIPELPHLDLPGFDTSDDNDNDNDED